MSKTLRDRFRSASRAWHIWVPVVVLVLFCLPRVFALLPAPVDFLDEIYQPNQTLKFVASKGQLYDKYGPTLNYLFLPSFGVSFAWWKVTGQFGHPSGEWPYGLSRPLEQLGDLILQTRLVMLALSAVMLGIVSATARQLSGSKLAALLATLLVLVGNYNVMWVAPLARPDAGMLAFLMIALALAFRIAVEGPTRSRAIWLGLSSTMAVGAKENAAPILVATFVALFIYLLLKSRGDAAKRRAAFGCALATFVSGAISYALTNIVFAPAVWWRRMQYWLVGDGLSGDVWARSATWSQHLGFVGEALWNNLGPAGVVLIPLLLLVSIVRRPVMTSLLLVPVVGCAVTVLAIPYTPDRFVLPGAAALVFPVAIGLAHVLRWNARKPILVLVWFTIGLNLWWCTITFHIANTTEQAMIELAARGEPKEKTKSLALMFSEHPSLRRLEWLGHRVDPRAMQLWTDKRQPVPDVVFAQAGRMQMIDEAHHMPGRAAHYKSESGFDLDKWPGMDALGYTRPEPFTVPLPPYLQPLGFMPLVAELRHRDMLVYRRTDATTMP